MRYREFRPSKQLSPDVECFWLLEGYEPSASARPERLMPDGCIELIVNLGDKDSKTHVLSAICCFSKFCVLTLIDDKSSSTVANALRGKVF